ncbi:hypothetical protein LX32DRAFT_350628 [Colletotrichum zoysiae]|uniref:Uncharacterized protein n=1 Tax=Colletotrichum zoysiae TaxID=1216348 RepID=A0AAD9HI73_9PEZI|nr:hypothetical protein LX32DRAFT_350628 [Colletotrichum zoysiae]
MMDRHAIHATHHPSSHTDRQSHERERERERETLSARGSSRIHPSHLALGECEQPQVASMAGRPTLHRTLRQPVSMMRYYVCICVCMCVCMYIHRNNVLLDRPDRSLITAAHLFHFSIPRVPLSK